MILVTSDNGPEMETWPDAAYTPFRCAKGSTWRAACACRGIVAWPSMIDPAQRSDGLFAFSDLLPTALALAGAPELVPTDRFIDGVDQSSFLLAPGSRRPTASTTTTGCGAMFSALRVGEYKFMLSSISDDDTDVMNPGGFTGISQKYPYGRLYNLYLDPKETRSYLIRKLAYVDAFLGDPLAPDDVRRLPNEDDGRAQHVSSALGAFELVIFDCDGVLVDSERPRDPRRGRGALRAGWR